MSSVLCRSIARIKPSFKSFKPSFGAGVSAFSTSKRAENKKVVISSPHAPPAIGPYSQAVKANGFIFCSGALGLDEKGNFTATDVAGQTERVMQNLGHVLSAAGADFSDVVKTTILLADMNDFATVNAIYAKCNAHSPLHSLTD